MTGGKVYLGRLAGIPVHAHVTFLVFLALVGLVPLLQGVSLGGALVGVLFMAAVFGSVTLHELGHALTARRLGIRTRGITLWPMGGVATMDRMPRRPAHEVMVALAGPAVNLLLGVALGLAGVVVSGGVGSFLLQLAVANIGLMVFNLLPAFPMDGGRVLRAALSAWRGPLWGTRMAARVGRYVAFGLALLGLFGSPMLLVIAGFVWLAGRGETQALEQELAAQRAAEDARMQVIPPGVDFPPAGGAWHEGPMTPGYVRVVRFRV